MPVLSLVLLGLPMPVLLRNCHFVSLCIRFTLKQTSLYIAGSIKSHSMLGGSKQAQEVGTCLVISTASTQVITSMSQSTFQSIAGLFMDWTAYDSLHAGFQAWKLKM